MQLEDGDVFFARVLLRFCESRRSIDANDETAGRRRIECAAVSRFLDAQNALYPSNNLVTRRIRRLVEIHIASGNVVFNRALQR